MALQAILNEEAFTGLNDTLKTEYKKRDDGKYILDVSAVDGFALDDIKGLKSALAKERQNVSDLTGKLGKFGDLDADKAKEALEKLEKFNKANPDEKVKEQIEAIKAQMEEKRKAEVEGLNKKASTYTKEIERLLIEATAAQVIAEQKGNTTLLMPHIKSKTRVREDNGQFIVDVLDEKGVPRISPSSGNNSAMSIKELVEEMKSSDTYAPAFEGSGASGGGVPPIKGTKTTTQSLASLGVVEIH